MCFLEGKIMWNFGKGEAFFETKLFVKDKKPTVQIQNEVSEQSQITDLFHLNWDSVEKAKKSNVKCD